MPFLLLIELVLQPALVYVLVSYVVDFDPAWVFTAVVRAALPPALNVFVIARQYDAYVERASSVILVGTAVSVATVTGLLLLIGADPAPPAR